MDLKDNNEIIENKIDSAISEQPAGQSELSSANQTPNQTHNPEKEFAPKTKKRIFFVLGLAVGLLLSGIGGRLINVGHYVPKDKYEYYQELDNNYGKYNEILRMIGEDPIATTPPSEIDDAKLKELVAGIGDPYAEYYTVEEYREFEKRYSDEYVGIGIAVMDENDAVVIKSVFDGGPAKEAGIEPEDIILQVDGEKPKDTSDAVNKISGETGTPVELLIGRGEEKLSFKMNRAKIEYDSVEYKELEDHKGVGYILITGFRENTAKDFKLAVRDLKNAGCDKFIIDLRDNGGGLTSESIDIADYLLPACKIMSENTKDGTETVYNSKASAADIDYVVLTNVNTASASEILAGAIQDNKGGLIIGEKTYGKGVTQITRKFKDGTAVKLTITEYFRPSGETVNEKGITPDIEVPSEDALEAGLKELGK